MYAMYSLLKQMAKACKNKQANKALLEEQLKSFINLRAAFGWKKMVRG